VGPWSFSTTDSLTLYDKSDIKWVLKTYSAYDEDAGIEYFRMQHELDAQLKATDTVTFEIAFTSKSDTWTNKMVMAEDASVCTMVQSSQNTVLWTQTPTDHYYTCDAFDCLWLGVGGAGDWTKGTDSGTGNDWTAPLADDDEDSPYCTPNSTDSDDTFVCKKLKCIIQREMDTGDSFDFSFTPSGTSELLYIRPGRALLGINDQAIGTSSWAYT